MRTTRAKYGQWWPVLCFVAICGLAGAAAAQSSVLSPIGAALEVASVVPDGTGAFVITYTARVSNMGGQQLTNLQITSDLADAFAEPTVFAVLGAESETLTVRSDFDGEAVSELLAGDDSLAPGATASVSFRVEVTPAAETSSFEVSILASAETPTGGAVSDSSEAGPLPDPDQDGDPGNNSDPTTVELDAVPHIGLAKEVVSVSDRTDDAYVIEYSFRVENTGNVDLHDVQVRDALEAAFPSPATAEVVAVTSLDFETNPEYNGIAVVDLLAAGNQLGLGDTGTVSVTIRVTPNDVGGWFRNRGFASARGPGNTAAVDLSQDGTDPDPDADGDPTNNQDYTEVLLAEVSAGGYVETTVHVSADPIAIDVETVAFDTYISVEGFTAKVDGTFDSSVFDSLTFTFSGAVGEIPLNSVVSFNPSTLSFTSWQTTASVNLLGVAMTDLLYIASTQSDSYNQIKISGAVDTFSLDATTKFGMCPVEFWESTICANWDWPLCSIPLSACVSFTDTVGFESFTLSAVGIPIFRDFFGFEGGLDITIEFTPTEKTLTPNLTFQTDWVICPEFTLYGEVVLDDSHVNIQGFSIYGAKVECPIGDATFRVAESFVDDKNSTIIGKDDYFELFGIDVPLASCCGTPGEIVGNVYFERPPAPSGALFGVGLLEVSFNLQFSPHFATEFDLSFQPTSPYWDITVTLRALW
jgi:hypothetical protein